MTAASISGTTGARLETGWVVSATARVLAGRALDLLILGLPFVILPAAVANLLPDDLKALRLFTGLPSLFFIGGASLLTYRELSGGERIGVGAAMRESARRFGTLWGISLISNLAMAVGVLLLVVPGIIVAVGWMPASTAAMAEGKTAFDALDRAWQLTRGSRWRLFGLLCIAVAAVFVLALLVVVAGVVLGLTLGLETGRTVGELTAAPLFAWSIQAITTVGAAAAYTALRRAAEGALGVADVFA